MKKIIFVVIILTLIIPVISFAHPGGTDSSGCHTCRTNCSSWGLSYGEYHCHNNRGSAQPLDPIHSIYGSGGTGYTIPAPDYSYPSYPTTPTCPFMSSYDSLSNSCKCYSGYVVGTDFVGKETCVSVDSKCTDSLGYGGKYNSLSNKCECRYGYLYDGNKCVSETSYCSDKIGLMSMYNSLSDKCECMSGYEFNGSSCVPEKTENQSCQETYGINSYSPISGKCGCNIGYEWATDRKSCIRSVSCYGDNVKLNNQCITLDESCQNSYGLNSIGIIGSKKLDNTGECKCRNGFEWNISKTLCVAAKTSILDSSSIKPKEIKKVIPIENTVKNTPSKKVEKKVIPILEQEKELGAVPTIIEPVKKVPWYKRIFNWSK